MTEYRDLVIADLADAEATANARITELEHENEILREMVSVALAEFASERAHLETARRMLKSLQRLPSAHMRPAA